QITISPPPPVASGSGSFFGDSGPGINTVLDTINPLQHIPFLTSVYQEATGDVASPAATLAGGALFGGPVGFVASLAGVIFESATGKTVPDAIMTALNGEGSQTTEVADNNIHLGDFAGDAKRFVCTQGCTLQQTQVATAAGPSTFE